MALPTTQKRHAATRGDEYECRVARLAFAEGALVKRKVDLEVHFGEPFQITDIDVLAIRFSPTLEREVVLGECKTSEAKNAPNAADRLLWNAGLQRLVGADGGFLAVSKKATDSVRRLASELGADVLDPGDVKRRERVRHLTDESAFGSHHPDLVPLQRLVRDTVRAEENIKRVYLFVRSHFWFEQPVPGIKRALGAIRTASQTWSSRLPAAERYSIEWLAREAVVCIAVAISDLAAKAYRQPEDAFARWLGERLAEGLASYRQLEAISKLVDDYVMHVLTQADVAPAQRVDALGGFAPTPPRYTEALQEVVQRFAARPSAARDVARLIDWLSGLAAREAVPDGGENFFVEPAETTRLARTLARFLVGQIGVQADLLAFIGDGSAIPDGADGAIPSREPRPAPAQDPGADRSEAAPQLPLSERPD